MATRRSWWEVRFPALYIVIGSLLIFGGILRISEWGDPAATTFTVFGLASGLIVLAAAIASLVKSRRTGEPSDEGLLLAQESDPSLRQRR